MYKQTDLRQTGVAKVECNNGTERWVPLFSLDVTLEVYTLLKEGRIKKVIELYRYNNNFISLGKQMERYGLQESIMDELKGKHVNLGKICFR